MLHLLHSPRELIAARVVLTPADHAQIAACRGPHNRLGFAYQLGFLHLTGRFPAQQPLEMLSDLLAFVAQAVAVEPPTSWACAPAGGRLGGTRGTDTVSGKGRVNVLYSPAC